jgi:hypothetical protein
VQAAKGPITGSLSSRLRARWAGNDHDLDLYEVLALDYVSDEHPWLSAHFFGSGFADLDGNSGPQFQSLADTYAGDVQGKLYEAYADIRPADSLVEARIGRQIDYLTPDFAFFDGVRVQTRDDGKREWLAGAYAGIPVYQYESSPQGDSLVGTFVEARPWEGGRARLDWMHFGDEYMNMSNVDDLYGAGVWQSIGTQASLEAQYTRLESVSRDLRLAVQARPSNSDLFVRATYYELFQPQVDQALALDPFSNALQQYEPFRRADVVVSSSLGEHTTLELGLEARRVTHSSDVGEFNRDWERYYATASLADVLHAGLTLALTLDDWNGDDRDIGTWGVAATQQIDKTWEVSGGTYYSLYKYDLNFNTERDDVRTFYVSTRWKKSEHLSFDLLYDYEDDDFDQYNVLTGGAIWSF